MSEADDHRNGQSLADPRVARHWLGQGARGARGDDHLAGRRKDTVVKYVGPEPAPGAEPELELEHGLVAARRL